MNIKLITITLFCATTLFAGETKEVLVGNNLKGEFPVNEYDNLDIKFSNGAHLQFRRTNHNDVMGPTTGIYAISFVDSVGTYSYDLDAPAISPNHLSGNSSNSFTGYFNEVWHAADLPEMNGVDTILHTTSVYDQVTIDSTQPGHLLFTYRRDLGSYLADVSIYEGINDWIYCRIDGQHSIRFRFMGLEYGETYMGVSSFGSLQWESDAENGIFNGEVAGISSLSSTDMTTENMISHVGNRLTLNSSVKSGAEVAITNSRGRICFKTTTIGSEISLPHLARGIYCWSIKSDSQLFKGKLSITK